MAAAPYKTDLTPYYGRETENSQELTYSLISEE